MIRLLHEHSPEPQRATQGSMFDKYSKTRKSVLAGCGRCGMARWWHGALKRAGEGPEDEGRFRRQRRVHALVRSKGMRKRNEVIMYIASNSNSHTFHLRSHHLSNWESDGEASQRERSRGRHRELIKTQSRPQLAHTHTHTHLTLAPSLTGTHSHSHTESMATNQSGNFPNLHLT